MQAFLEQKEREGVIQSIELAIQQTHSCAILERSALIGANFLSEPPPFALRQHFPRPRQALRRSDPD
jgi:hypothetical protein